ncbi:hypothetical protein HDV05_007875, partial [Chytridiales sp. JEL 0842]
MKGPSRIFPDATTDAAKDSAGNQDDLEMNEQEIPDAAYFSFKNVWATGESLIIMGPSGCGKSSLLDVLAQRRTLGKWGGDIRVNGAPCTKARFVELTGYVPHEDIEIPELTVRETLQFAAALRLSPKLPKEQVERKKETLPKPMVGHDSEKENVPVANPNFSAELLFDHAEEMENAYMESELIKENEKKIENIHRQLGSVNLYLSDYPEEKKFSDIVKSNLQMWQRRP